MNEFAGWSLWHGDEDGECSKCGMADSKNDCCKDEHKQVKLKSEHQKTNIVQSVLFNSIAIAPQPVPVYNFTINETSVQYPVSHAPPLATGKPLYILYAVFLI
jgi:hypothetical protein